MTYITSKEAAALWGVHQRTIQNYCRQGLIPGCKRFGRTWLIPKDAAIPAPTDVLTHLPSTASDMEQTSITTDPLSIRLQRDYLQGFYDLPLKEDDPVAANERNFYDHLYFLCMASIMHGDFPRYEGLNRKYLQADNPYANMILSAVALAMFDLDSVAPQVMECDFRSVPSTAHGFLVELYARYLYASDQRETAYAVAKSFLCMRTDSLDTKYPDIIMNLICAAVCNDRGATDDANRWIKAALDIALPDGFYGPLIEMQALLSGSLERYMQDSCPAQLEELSVRQVKASQGWVNFYSHYHGIDMGELLTMKEFYAGRFLERGFSYMETADRLQLTTGQMNSVVRSLYEKKNIHRKKDVCVLPRE